MTTSLLEVRHISKYYGNIIALRDITTSVNAGEVTCVLGDNGAGKSSFIKIIAGAHQQTDGQLLVEGDEVLFDSLATLSIAASRPCFRISRLSR